MVQSPRVMSALCAAMALSSLTTGPALAAESPSRVVAVIDVSEDSKAHTAIVHDIELALSKKEGWAPKDVHAVLNAGSEVEDNSNIKTAQGFIKAGRAAVKSGDAEEAAIQFDSALTLYEKSFAFLPDPGEYRNLLLELGAARLKAGLKDAAMDAFRRAAVARADMDDAALDAEAKAAFQKALDKVNESSLGAVSLTTLPANAEVFVDGRYKGISPTTVAGLRVGKHFLAIFKRGYARMTIPVDISDEVMREKEVELKPARRKLLYDQLVDKLRGELDPLSGELPEDGPPKGADGVKQVESLLFSEVAIVVRISGPVSNKKIEAYIFDTASQIMLNRVIKTVPWKSRNKAAIATLVDELLNFDYAEALGGQIGPGPGAAAEGGIETKWWFWTIIGVGVLGITAGVVVATLPDEPGPAFPNDGNGAVVISF